MKTKYTAEREPPCLYWQYSDFTLVIMMSNLVCQITTNTHHPTNMCQSLTTCLKYIEYQKKVSIKSDGVCTTQIRYKVSRQLEM